MFQFVYRANILDLKGISHMNPCLLTLFNEALNEDYLSQGKQKSKYNLVLILISRVCKHWKIQAHKKQSIVDNSIIIHLFPTKSFSIMIRCGMPNLHFLSFHSIS